MNLSKICNDLRLLASGPKTGLGEIVLPARQNGSSIMPGKINPVIPEVVNQVAFKVAGNDTTICMASEAGQLELNAFEPVMFTCLFESIECLTHAALQRQLQTLIDSLPVPEYRTLLELRYLSGSKWEEIAEAMSMHVRWVYRMHGRALQAAQKILDTAK